jgi:hypothetical protein
MAIMAGLYTAYTTATSANTFYVTTSAATVSQNAFFNNVGSGSVVLAGGQPYYGYDPGTYGYVPPPVYIPPNEAAARQILELAGHFVLSPEVGGLGYNLPRGARFFALPDGSRIHVDASGNYRVDDKDAKVVYKANRLREFNPYINAADLLEAFIGEAGKWGVDQTSVLDLPVGAFINWLVLRAAERDGDNKEGLPSVESALALPNPNPRPTAPRCGLCGRFIRQAWAAAQIAFCSPEHMQLRLARLV